MPTAPGLSRRALLIVLGACIALGLAFTVVDPLFVLVGFVAVLVGAAVVSEPYYGVLLYLFLLYGRPGDMFPPLAPARPALLGVALLGAAYALQVLVYRRVKPIMNLPLIFMTAFTLTVMASIPGSFYRSLSLDTFFELARIVFMTYLIVHLVDTADRLEGFMATLVLVMATLATIVSFRFFLFPDTHIDNGGSGGIAGGFLGDGNDFALAQNVVLPLAIAVATSTRRKWLKPLMAYAVAIGSVAVMVTYSRGGFLGLIAVFGAYGVAWVVRTGRYAVGAMVLAIAAVLATIGVFLFAPEGFVERIGSISDYEEDESALGRLDAWGAGVDMYIDHPLIGVGAGAFPVAYGTTYKPPNAVSNAWRVAHSAFFQVLGELGTLGIFTFYGLVIVTWFTAYGYRRTRLPDPRANLQFHAAARAVTVSIVGWFISSLFLSVAYYPHLYVLVMVVTSLQNIARRFDEDSLPIVEEVTEVFED